MQLTPVASLDLQTLSASALLVACCMIAACANQGGSQTHISNRELLGKIKAGTAPLILDVRSGWEFNKGHVPGAVHMPFLSSFFRQDDLATSPDKPVVVYCEHGPRAGVARLALRLAGFEHVLYLEGHMSRWRKDGLPTKKPSS